MNENKSLRVDNYCFVCGKENPKGLKVKFITSNGKVKAEMVLDKEYQGYSGIIHGGIIAALLDEACAYAAIFLGYYTVTAEIKIRYKNILKPGEKIIIEAEANQIKSKLIKAKAQIRNVENILIAEAEGKLIIKEKIEKS
ncbi:MAG: PaaI family thioesterase [Thermodesulfobacterium geofontis]|uniref:Acyl-coenzyme A thioesterase THEM4 n=2 Tax=Thermodesulfobacterium geofontis TaxID=1295609 RepID=A0A2N7PPS3_9BACT|nr:MAG: PaaI family thioesterase [Thermodesulfobacterium geofontis]